MNCTNFLAPSTLPSLVIAKPVTSPYGAGSEAGGPVARDRGRDPGVLGQVLAVVLALGAGRQGVLPQPGELVEDERRPDQHRRLAREVGRARRVDVLAALDRVRLYQVGEEADRVDALWRVERGLAAGIAELAVVA